MRAVQIKKYGDRGVLELVDIDPPKVEANQVLVEIHSSSVNPIDWKLRQGDLKLIHPLSMPAILGFDLSGVVKDVGAGVSKFKVGDEVFSRSNKKAGEAAAELIALDEDMVALKSAKMSHDEAAAVPLAALTALQALRDKGRLKAGQKVLINGASGGVGVYAVQIARAMGAEVVGVCSGANVELVKSLGAQVVIDYKTDDPLSRLESFDVIFDAVAKMSPGKAKSALKSGGYFVTTVPGPSIFFALTLGNIFSSRKAAFIMVHSSGKDLEYLRDLTDQGKLQSVIDSTFSLEQIKDAHKRSESGRVKGKVVVKVR